VARQPEQSHEEEVNMDMQSLPIDQSGRTNDNAASAHQLTDTLDTTKREWLGLRELSVYANLCERTLRSWIHSPRDPLPAVKVRGKVLVRKADFDRYLERHRVQPLAALNEDRILEDIFGKTR
jgi:excisionase family DNA binding protein